MFTMLQKHVILPLLIICNTPSTFTIREPMYPRGGGGVQNPSGLMGITIRALTRLYIQCIEPVDLWQRCHTTSDDMKLQWLQDPPAAQPLNVSNVLFARIRLAGQGGCPPGARGASFYYSLLTVWSVVYLTYRLAQTSSPNLVSKTHHFILLL